MTTRPVPERMQREAAAALPRTSYVRGTYATVCFPCSFGCTRYTPVDDTKLLVQSCHTCCLVIPTYEQLHRTRVADTNSFETPILPAWTMAAPLLRFPFAQEQVADVIHFVSPGCMLSGASCGIRCCQ